MRGALAVAAPLLMAAVACYKYSPVGAALTPQTPVTVSFTPPRRLTLDTLGGQATVDSVRTLWGIVSARNGDTILVAVDHLNAPGPYYQYFPVGTVLALSASAPGETIAQRRATLGTRAGAAISAAIWVFPWIAMAIALKVPLN